MLLQHGLFLQGSKIGTCCFNIKNPEKYSDYQVNEQDCRQCVNQETRGMFSYRQGVNQKYGFDYPAKKIVVLDVVPNNNCNLTCKICGPSSSSSWVKLLDRPITENYNQSLEDFETNVKQYDLSNLLEINFSGGEPFLNNNIQRYISRLTDLADFSKVTLRFSNNGTVRLTPKLIDFFSQFKLVMARFSLDDIEQGHEYQRFPGNWSEWLSNWEYFLEHMPHNVIPGINRTVSMLNINRLHLLEQWIEQYPISKHGDKIELVDHFAFGRYQLQITQPVYDYITTNYYSDASEHKYVKNLKIQNNCDAFKSTVTEHDALQGTSFKDFNPELHRLIFV
jgi:hypothetical protein